MKKRNLLLAAIFAALLNLPSWSQSQICGTALSISNGITIHGTSNQEKNWGSFTASQTNHKLVVWMELDTVAPDLDSIIVYSGACNNLSPIYSAAFTSSGSIAFTLSGLTVSNNYFVYVKRQLPCTNCTYSTRVISYYVETQVSACADMVGNGSFESHSALPGCGPNWPPLPEFRPHMIDLADRWCTQYYTIQDYFSTSTLTYPSTSDYFHTSVGNYGCVNVNPSPRTGSAHAGMCFTSDNINGLTYREMIISDDGTLVPIVMGTTYCLTYYYKLSGPQTAPFTMGAKFTGQLTNAVTQGGSQTSLGYVSQAANGWKRVDCYMTAQWNGACLFSIQFLSAGLSPNQNTYIIVDDVSMVESVGLDAQSGLTACTYTNMIFQASGATTYNWSVTPSTGVNIYPTGGTCVAIPNTVGTYTITVAGTTPSGCTTSASHIITINATPTVSVTPAVASICSSSGSTTLTATPNVSFYTYQWYSQSSGLIAGANTYQYQTSTAGTYYVTVTSSLGCVGQSNMVTVTFNQPPLVTLSSTNEHCEDANDGTANAAASNGTLPYIYSWTNLPSQTTSTATGLSAGTYTVTVTDANGCTAIGTVTVGTSTMVAPVISTDAVNGNLCNSNTVTYIIDNFNSAYTYSASYSVQPISVTSTLSNQFVVTWPSGCNDVTMTLSAYSGTPNCTVIASVTLFGCCGACNQPTGTVSMNGTPSHDDLNEFLNDYNPTNSPTGIIYRTGSTAPYDWYYNNPNNVLYLNGTFTVDPSIALSFNIMPYSIVKMGPNAKIQITGTSQSAINIYQSHVSAGCNYMWLGIFAAGTSQSINILGSANQACLIEDAQEGVSSLGGANFTCQNAVFNKCYTSTQAQFYSGNHPASVTNCVFTCRNLIFTALQVSSLKGTNPNTCQLSQRPIGTNQTAVLLAPYAGKRSYRAQYLNMIGSTTVNPVTLQVTAWTNINFGTGSNFADLNIVDNMDYGVYAVNSNANVVNNHFQNLSGPPAVSKTNPNYGMGVFGTNDAMNFLKKITVGNLNSRNSFYNCNRAIDLNGYYDASVIGNCFLSTNVYAPGSLTQSPYGNNGIFVKSGRYINTEIANNSIINWNSGIAFFSEYLPSGTSYTRLQGALWIHDNEVKPVVSGLPTTQFVGTAITAHSLLACPSCSSTQSIWGTPRIENNTGIVDVFNGIDVQGWPENTIVADNIITLRLQPNYSSTVYKQAGIRSIATQGVIIYRNNITGDLATGNTTAKVTLRGIYCISNNAVKVRCNTTTTVGQSLVFDGLNIGPVTNNTMNAATDGLVLMNNGIIGQQGIPVMPNQYPQGVVSDNKWIGPFANSDTKVDGTSCATNSRLYVRPGYPYTPSINMGSFACKYDVVNFSMYNLFGTPLSFDCSSAPGIMGDGGDNDKSRVQLMEKTAQDSISMGEYATESSWTGKQAVYEMLKLDSVLMDSSVVLQEFYSATDSTNIGKVTNTGILLIQTNTDSAASVNQTINPELQIEQNYKELDNIYISLMNGTASDSMQIQILEAIALQCPQQGGLAVYRARVLLNVLYDDVRYWEDNCASSARMATPEEPNAMVNGNGNVVLYPNPSNGFMTLAYNLSSERQGEFVIYDLLGNTIAKTNLAKGMNEKQIDLTALASGIYYYRVTVGGIVIKNDKIVIAK